MTYHNTDLLPLLMEAFGLAHGSFARQFTQLPYRSYTDPAFTPVESMISADGFDGFFPEFPEEIISALPLLMFAEAPKQPKPFPKAEIEIYASMDQTAIDAALQPLTEDTAPWNGFERVRLCGSLVQSLLIRHSAIDAVIIPDTTWPDDSSVGLYGFTDDTQLGFEVNLVIGEVLRQRFEKEAKTNPDFDFQSLAFRELFTSIKGEIFKDTDYEALAKSGQKITPRQCMGPLLKAEGRHLYDVFKYATGNDVEVFKAIIQATGRNATDPYPSPMHYDRDEMPELMQQAIAEGRMALPQKYVLLKTVKGQTTQVTGHRFNRDDLFDFENRQDDHDHIALAEQYGAASIPQNHILIMKSSWVGAQLQAMQSHPDIAHRASTVLPGLARFVYGLGG